MQPHFPVANESTRDKLHTMETTQLTYHNNGVIITFIAVVSNI